MNTTITIKKELKAKLDEIGLKSESYNDIIERLYASYEKNQTYVLKKYASKLLTLHESSTKADTYHRKILEKVASGESKSWDQIKRELLE
ncbi:MAG: hypothetical protein ACMXYF_05790 [Candidatus Woesearchaeota archaeon]